MPKTPEQIALIERSLRELRDWLREDLEVMQDLRSNKHKRVALYLRLLLCDNGGLLLEYSKAKDVSLFAYVPPADFNAAIGRQMQSAGCDWNVVSWLPVNAWTKVPAKEFLNRCAGVIPGPDGKAVAFSVTQVIKRVANWDGIAHLDLDLDKRKTLNWMGGGRTVAESGEISEHIDIKFYLHAVGEWTVAAINEVLK